jgi:hypothetical protein
VDCGAYGTTEVVPFPIYILPDLHPSRSASFPICILPDLHPSRSASFSICILPDHPDLEPFESGFIPI